MEPRVIKRYANRKLYDTDLGRFTTLDELSTMLESGIRFVVRDHSSGEDRTDDVLAQVLGRRVKSGGSSDLLSGLLKAPAQIAQSLVGETVTGSSTSSSATKSSKKSETKKSETKKSETKKSGPKKSGSKGAKSSKKTGAGPGSDTSASSATKGAKATKSTKKADATEDEVERQQRELEELRSQVSELTQAVTMLVQERLDERSRSSD